MTIKKHFSDTPAFKYPCPECGSGSLKPDQSSFRKVEPRYSDMAHRHPDWDPDWMIFRFCFSCVCDNQECGEIAFVTGDGRVDQRYDDRGQAEFYEHFTIKSFFPSPRLCYIPSEVPDKVEQQLYKSFSLFWVDVSAAANALRSSLESLLDEMNVPSQEQSKKGSTVRMSLHRRLEVWSKTNEEHAELCLALKEVGNLGSHGDIVETEHYFSSLKLYSYILKQLFENDAQKMKELAESIRDDIKSKKALT
nr:DUF4145 domain-containing protein [uncultured Cohaesibacter sp.]